MKRCVLMVFALCLTACASKSAYQDEIGIFSQAIEREQAYVVMAVFPGDKAEPTNIINYFEQEATQLCQRGFDFSDNGLGHYITDHRALQAWMADKHAVFARQSTALKSTSSAQRIVLCKS
ncbi:hypothetical protein [Thaumasiovibrio subtropicus]|uniref:hypothetical protein n=1 Tax=Thaumasiovibrio subtropicus TaxID=1891207 RepID=UPI00131E3BA3|nr:hypothetical protein [Thaumasiovibrio subtropicus]